MVNKLDKKISLFIMMIVLILGIGTVKTASASSFENPSLKGIESENISEQNYSIWSKPINSYLYYNEDGTYNRVEIIKKYIYSETYSADFEYKSQKKTKIELDIVGGVYINNDAYFVIEGKENLKAKSDTTEFRIIKYDKNWNKVDSVNLKNMNTTTPFEAGCCRFTEDNGMLYIRTCHKMYNGHQASVMIKLDMSNCKVITADCDVANVGCGYVSHSFNQFLDCKDGVIYACDHGDAYPRGIAMMRFDLLEKGEEYFDNEVTSVVPFKFAGEVGYNYTGATLGGFGLSSTHAIAVGSSVKQNSSFVKNWNSNLYVATVDLSNFENDGSSLSWLTSYKEGGKRKVSTPQMIRLDTDRFFVMWEEYIESKFDRLCYVIIDGKGSKISKIQNIEVNLSDCQPILCEDKIVWYVTEDSTPIFYQMPIDGSEIPDVENGTIFTKNGLKYKIIKSGKVDGKAVIVGYDKSTVPTYLEADKTIRYGGYSYKITEIGEKAFYKCTKIQGTYISSNITKIGADAFNGCKKLVSIQLEYKKYSTKNVGKNAFKNISSKAIIITPDGKKNAYQKLFQKRGVPKTATFTDINSMFYW